MAHGEGRIPAKISIGVLAPPGLRALGDVIKAPIRIVTGGLGH
ncbi:MAG: hypothetical protein AB1592_10075 [Pseudomonadota bacterium]